MTVRITNYTHTSVGMKYTQILNDKNKIKAHVTCKFPLCCLQTQEIPF